MRLRRNERDWAGQLISWIKEAIGKKIVRFQDVTNDTGLQSGTGRTKFPDILLFVDKSSGIVFNGWELKFPDTAVDDPKMLKNALEKAKRLRSDSFVTWNCSEAVIWGIPDGDYSSIASLSKIKTYYGEKDITSRDDVADPDKYLVNEPLLKARALEILQDLNTLFISGRLKCAVDISSNIVDAISDASNVLIPQLCNSIKDRIASDVSFRRKFDEWMVYEGSTLNILSRSSKRKEQVSPEFVLARFAFYNLVGKILLGLTICDNLSGELKPLTVEKAGKNVLASLDNFFSSIAKIDYQAVFKPYFTDTLDISEPACVVLTKLLESLTEFDFRVLPDAVVGNVLENLVPPSERQKFGQYFTSPLLADLVSYPVVRTRNDKLFDPTSGTGTFLCAFYHWLNRLGLDDHSALLSQIWGNDVSHFPAILSVINLYKQRVAKADNFPRVLREDFFNLSVGDEVSFPDSQNHSIKHTVSLPLFDGIASNFPFVQQEDVPSERLASLFRKNFQDEQKSFMCGADFRINERSDYFAYCIYNSIRFLKPDGVLAAITSNAWLGKDYGLQLKRFILDNFSIKYAVRSSVEHWFCTSHVSTIFVVLERTKKCQETRFVSLNKKLSDLFDANDENLRHRQVEDFYREVDFCDTLCSGWEITGSNSYGKSDGSISVCLVDHSELRASVKRDDVNWSMYFLPASLTELFRSSICICYSNIVSVVRGERTGWNEMFILDADSVTEYGIEDKYLLPLVKSPSDINSIELEEESSDKFLFVCSDPFEDVSAGGKRWIARFENRQNKNGSKTIKECCAGHRPYWYSLRPKSVNIVTAINPYKRLFFSFSRVAFAVDQRLIGISVSGHYDIELVSALLNSVLTLLWIELRGTSRNLGALDLNSDYVKSLKAPNPDLLDEDSKAKIISAFESLKKRKIRDIEEELEMDDRKKFDSVVFEAYHMPQGQLPAVYRTLKGLVSERVSLKG